MEWTIGYLTKIKFPIIDLENAPVLKVLEFARRKEYPENYTVSLVVRDERKLQAVRLKLKTKDISLLELLGIVAARSDMDLLIQPGVVTLVPKMKLGGQGEDPPAKPQQADKVGREPDPAKESK